MKAAQINQFGGPEVLKINNNAVMPEPADDQVLVEVKAAGVNPFDYKVRSGATGIPVPFPATLGGDAAGIVRKIGANAKDFKVGDEVYGQANAVAGNGSYADFTVVKAESLHSKPKTLDFINAAAVPLAGSSAFQALIDHLKLQPNQKILIHGGAGGIGTYAIQIAKHIGAHVITTVAAKDVDFAKSLGADEVIDYETQDFTTVLKDLDAVFDTVGGDTAEKSYQVLKTGGGLVSMNAQPNQQLIGKYSINFVHQQSIVTNHYLHELKDLIDSGKLKVFVDKVFNLDDAGQAQAYLEAGGHRGKVVLKVN